MKKTMTILALASLPLALTACGKKAEQPAPAAAPSQASAMTSMASTAAPTKSQTGKGEGKVVSVNAETGAISIEHGPIKEINWPAMTMGFTAKPALLKGIAVGDKVAFEIKGSGETYEVIALTIR